LLVDNDVFVLLAAARCLDRAIALLGFQQGHVLRLDALPHMLRKSIAGRSTKFNRFTTEQREEALCQTERFAPLPKDSPKNEQAERDLTPEIQFDAELYATLAAQPLTFLHSGDSTAMKRVAGVTGLLHVKTAVAGRIIALESILYLLVQNDGYSPTAECFRESMAANETVKWAFRAPEQDLMHPLESVQSYLQSLCRVVKPGFIFCPPCPNSNQGECTLPPVN